MNYLFIHQNFPGQYRHVVRDLAGRPGNTVVFVSQPTKPPVEIAGVRNVTYERPDRAIIKCHPLTVDLDVAIRTGSAVAERCKELRDEGFHPDLIVGHSGWGETVFVKDVFPDSPLLSYFEFYYHAQGVDLDFDPEFESLFRGADRVRVRNAISLMAYDATDWGHSPTLWQRELFPPEMRGRITALHEGVDTTVARPDPDASFVSPDGGLRLSRRDEVITYVSRSLEPYRGFHVFMRALPEILKRRPQAQVVLVGDDGAHYGAAAPPGTSYREILLGELDGRLDRARVHFLGQIPYEDYLRLLQVSSVHVYLTYPFVLSWSFLEAMASGCLVVGSATPPVLEVLEDRANGLAVDFFSSDQIADRVEEVLRHPDRMQSLRDAARRTVLERYDLNARILPRWRELFEDLIAGRAPELDP